MRDGLNTGSAGGASPAAASRIPDVLGLEEALDRARDLLADATRPGQDPSPPSVDVLDRFVERARLDPGDVVVVAQSEPSLALGWFVELLHRGLVPALAAGSTPRDRLRLVASGIGARAVVRTHRGDIQVEVAERPPPRRVPGEVVILTSGTSGLATGVVHRLDRLLLNGGRHLEATGHGAQDRLLVSLPVHYSFALVAQVLGAVAIGARVTFDGPPFSGQRFAATVADRGVTSASLTPRLLPALLDTGTDLPPSLRTLTVGGSVVPAHLLRRSLDAVRAEVFVTYGLTEAGPRVATLAARHEPEHRHGSVGLPLPGVRVETSAAPDALEGQTELVVHTDTRCVATRGPRAPVPPGPLHTGDLGHVDEDGYVWVRGRCGDVVVVAGEKVRLPDLEKAAESLPEVRRARFSVRGPHHDAEALDAVLAVVHDAPDDPGYYRRALARVLRRVELPRDVRVERGEDEWRK